MSSEDAAAAETFGDALSKLSKVTDRGIQKIGAALAPALTDLADRFAELAAVAGKWIEDNRGIIQTVAMLAAGLVAGGAALAAFGTAAAAVGTTLGLLATGLQLVGAAIGFLVSPIGLVTAGLVGLGALFVTQTEAGKQMASELAAGFEGLKADALTAFGGISDALATGDIGKAAEILWLALKLQWTKGVNFVLGKWNEIKAAATNLWQDIGFAIERTMIDTVANLQKFWNGFRDFFLDMLDRLLGFWKSWVATITLQWGDIDKAAQETEQKIAARTAARKADNAKITAEAQKQKDLLAEGQAQVTGDRPAIDTQPLAAELEAARAAFEKSVGEAKEKRIAADQAKAAADAEQAKIPGPADLSKVMTETQTAAKASASGTFSAAAAAGLGATSVQERAAKASEETAANTKYLVDTAKRGPFVFQR
jgi:hypothetical protein